MFNNHFITEDTEVYTHKDGWVYASEVKPTDKVMLMNRILTIDYLKPQLLSNEKFTGILKGIETNSENMTLDPQALLMVKSVSKKENAISKKVKEIIKGDLITRYDQWQMVHTIKDVPYDGNVYRLFFGETLLMPIRFGNDYCLFTV